jgi:hypothetical protein
MTLRLNLGQYLQRHQITAYRLVNEVQGKVAPNTIYSLARKPAQRIDLNTVSEVLHALERLTGEKVELAAVLEEVQEAPKANLSHLTADPARAAYDPARAKKFRYGGTSVPVTGGPSAEQMIAEERGRALP